MIFLGNIAVTNMSMTFHNDLRVLEGQLSFS